MPRHSGAIELLLASIFWGAVPTITILSGGSNNPLLFVFLFWLAGVIALFVYLLLTTKHLFKAQNLKIILNTFLNRKDGDENQVSAIRIFRERSFLLPFQQFLTLALVLSFAFVHPAIVAVLFESWPIFFILLLARNSQDKYYFTRRDFYLVLLTAVFIGFVVFSDVSSDVSILSFNLGYALGILFIVFGIICLLQNIPRLLQAIKIEKQIKGNSSEFRSIDKTSKIVLALNLLARTVPLLIVGIVLLFSCLTNIGPGISGMSAFGITMAIIGGAIIGLGGEIFTSYGNVKGKNLKVQMLRYFTPAFGGIFIIILAMLDGSLSRFVEDIPSIDNFNWLLFSVGLFGIIATNIVANFTHQNKR